VSRVTSPINKLIPPEKRIAIPIFTALIIVGAIINNGAPVMPITLSNFFCLLAGLYLGPRGFIAVFLYLLLGTAGLPIFARAAAGPATFLGPTGGYLIGFLFMALVAGLLRDKKTRSLIRNISASVVAMVVLYLIGTPYMAMVSDYYKGDLGKAAADMFWGFYLIKDLPLSIGAGILFHFSYPKMRDFLGDEELEDEAEERAPRSLDEQDRKK
jgi:biotin transport system substrate-specific component